MKVLVIGAGPAGLSAAYTASKNGCEVKVFEKNGSLGLKPCGEAMAKEALDFIDMKPSKKFITNEAKGFIISYKGKFIREASFEESATSPGCIIDKPIFLEALMAKAEGAGAEVMFNKAAEAVDPHTGKVKLGDGTTIEGDLIVCADGLGSIARDHLDYSGYDIATCIQCYCDLPPDIEMERLYLDIIGEGYAWAFPKRDSLNIGVGLPNSSSSIGSLRDLFNRHVEKLGARIQGKINYALVSVGGPISSFCLEKLAVAGEAAGCVMPLSGEGIRFGIFGGSIAHRPAYQGRFMKKYGNKMKNSRGMLLAIESLSDSERVDLLERLKDPMQTLEGNLPITSLLGKPKLLKKMARVFFRS
jgi:digeranylgeranylglycerophospholipid reductase